MDEKSDLRTPVSPVLSPEQLWREMASLKELLLTRIEAIEKGIAVAHDDLVRVPTEIQKAIGNLKELHEVKIHAVEAKFDAALVAMDKATASAFASSEKAIMKSEDAQKELNIKNNEFRGQLRDQSEMLMPRTESLSNLKNVNDRLDEVKEQTEIKLELIRKEIQVLREFRSEGGGKSAGVALSWGILIAALGIIGTLISIAVGITLLLRR